MKNNIIGNWQLIEKLGEGGNGEVWKVISLISNDFYAMKRLKDGKIKDKESKIRFSQELKTLTEIKNKIDGVIKVIDFSATDYWFVMPLAQNSLDIMSKLPIFKKIELLAELAKTLHQLHGLGISHRDIKPANILYLNEQLVLADFGLVRIDSEQFNITKESKKKVVGAMSTIAPEMKRNPSESDGKKADVYSFMKTVWIYLTNIILGFDGEYISDSSIGLKNNLKGYEEFIHLKPLDNLLGQSTKTNPEDRPTMELVLKGLISWIENAENHPLIINDKWLDLLNTIHPISIPEYCIWKDKRVLIEIAKIFADKLISFTLVTDKNNHLYNTSAIVIYEDKMVLSIRKLTKDEDLENDQYYNIALDINKIEFRHIESRVDLSYFRMECVSYQIINEDEDVETLTPIEEQGKTIFYFFNILSTYSSWYYLNRTTNKKNKFKCSEKTIYKEIMENLSKLPPCNTSIENYLEFSANIQ